MIKKSPRFLFLNNGVETVQVGADRFQDVFSGPASTGEIAASTGPGKVWIRLPGDDISYETSMASPTPEQGLVEIAPAVLEAVKQADPDQNDNVRRQLRRELEAFLSNNDD